MENTSSSLITKPMILSIISPHPRLPLHDIPTLTYPPLLSRDRGCLFSWNTSGTALDYV
jgi:hypothetical protein